MTDAAIEEIATADAAPTEPPYRISDKPGKDTATFKVKATAAGVIRAVRVRLKPSDRNHGQRLYHRGIVCGSGDRCSPNARSLFHSSPFDTDAIAATAADLAGEPDGDYEVKAWALADEGWSS